MLVHLHSSVNVSQIQKAPSFLKNRNSLIKNREFLFGSVVLGMNDTKLHLLKIKYQIQNKQIHTQTQTEKQCKS